MVQENEKGRGVTVSCCTLQVRGHSQKVQADIILQADIICCTLSTSGGGLLESTFARQRLDPFSCVIVDEVRKAV